MDFHRFPFLSAKTSHAHNLFDGTPERFKSCKTGVAVGGGWLPSTTEESVGALQDGVVSVWQGVSFLPTRDAMRTCAILLPLAPPLERHAEPAHRRSS
ncbi:hypothetical protein ACP70R_004115 [Stipagrostis hirtigluma subsp. patula]